MITKDEELYPYIPEILEFCKEVNGNHISCSLIQRKYRVGYNRAARLIDKLEDEGYVKRLERGMKMVVRTDYQ